MNLSLGTWLLGCQHWADTKQEVVPTSGKLRLHEEQVCAAQDNTANSNARSRQWWQTSKESCAGAGISADPDWDWEEAAEVGAAAGYEGADEWVEGLKF